MDIGTMRGKIDYVALQKLVNERVKPEATARTQEAGLAASLP